MTTAAEDDSDRTRWVILGALCLARTSMGFQFQSIASISGDLVREMGFSYAEIGTLIGLYMLPGIVVALPGGALMAKFGDKSLAVFGLALMVTGDALAAAVAPSGQVGGGGGCTARAAAKLASMLPAPLPLPPTAWGSGPRNGLHASACPARAAPRSRSFE